MKKLITFYVCGAILFFVSPIFVHAYTLVDYGTISTDTEWTIDKSPYLIQNNFTVPSGVTLTIDPGVVLKFTGGGDLYISGAVVANGTPDEKIYFTNIGDNSVGSLPDDFYNNLALGLFGIVIQGGTFSLTNGEIRNAEYGITIHGGGLSFNDVDIFGGYPNIDASYADLSMTNVDFDPQYSEYAFILGTRTNLTVNNLFIHDGENGIATNGGSVSISGTGLNISRMTRQAIVTYWGGVINLSDSTFSALYPGDGGSALSLTVGTSLTLASSTIVNVYGAAINVLNGSDVSLMNTTIASTTKGIEINNNVSGLPQYNPSAVNTIASSTIVNVDDDAIEVSHTNLVVSGSDISDASYGVQSDQSSVNVSSSSLTNISEYALANTDSSPLAIAENNYWGAPSGPYNPNSNPTGHGVSVSDNVDFSNWLGGDPTIPPPLPTCCSNVMFLPGIEGSRLYTPGTLIENELWEPNRDNDGKLLEFDANGNSINQNIYTKVGDVVDRAYKRFPIIRDLAPDIYTNFISDMDSLKSDGTINDWEPIAYDWRLPYDQILDSGKVAGDEISYLSATDSPYIIQELKRLARDSKTGKVTIVAHSNGGLLAKDLMIKLQAEGISNLVDKIVFVAVPQTGAPDAIGALLHGFGTSIPIPTFFSANEGRELAENMPMTYNLLPSQAYFDSVTTPVITYDATSTISLIESSIAQYGQSINSYDNFEKFLLGREGRAEPSYDDLTYPSLANQFLLDSAANTHSTLDNWTPPANIKLIQIAGWGDDTPSGIYYYQGVNHGEATLEYKPNLVVDGDGTVPVPSALATPTSPNVERYWLDLGKYNSDNKSDLSHGTIFNSQSLEDFLKNTIQNGTSSLPQYLSTTSPSNVSGEELRFFLHSASSTLDVYDDLGNHTGISSTTGLVEENISGTTYKTFGDVTLVTIPATHLSLASTSSSQTNSSTSNISKPENPAKVKNPKIKIVTTSNTSASVTIGVDDAVGNDILSSESFVDIPVSTSSVAEIDIATSTPEISDISSVNISDESNNSENFDVLPAESATTSSILVSDDVVNNKDNNVVTAETENNVSQAAYMNQVVFHPGGSAGKNISITKSQNTTNVELPFNTPIEVKNPGKQNVQRNIVTVTKPTPKNQNTQSAAIIEAVSKPSLNFIWSGLKSVFKSVTDFFGSIF